MENWKDIAGSFAEAGLTTIGSVLGGPLGGTIGGVLGKAAASALGVEETPQAVQAAIEADPDGAAKALRDVETEALTLYGLQGKMVAEVNATARAEMGGDWFQRSWRPLNGYIFGLVVLGYGLAIVAAALRGVFLVDAGAMNVLTALLNGVGNMILFLTPSGAVVGVTAWTRGREKEAAITGLSPPSILQQVGQAVVKGRAAR